MNQHFQFSLRNLLIFVGLLCGILAFICTFNWRWKRIDRLQVGDSIKIDVYCERLTFESREVIRCELWDDDELVKSGSIGCSPWNTSGLEFGVHTAEAGKLIGLYEKAAPHVLLMIYDSKSKASWFGLELDDSQVRVGSSLAARLQQEHLASNLVLASEVLPSDSYEQLVR